MEGDDITSNVPKWPLVFLRWICSTALYEIVEGDLLEQFEEDEKEHGLKRARWIFVWNALLFYRSAVIMREGGLPNSNRLMMTGYFKFACRHLMRNKVFSAVNVLGLSLGIVACLIIIQYVSFEMSYDDFHKNKQRIFRVTYEQFENGDSKTTSARNFIGISRLLQQHFPEVEASTGFDRTAEQAYFILYYKGRTLYEPGSFYQTDANFFKVFPSLLLRGDPSSALNDPHNLVLSEKMARSIFGEEDPIGKRLENKSYSYSQVANFVVTGVLRDIPENSHFHVNFIAQNSNQEEVGPANYWTGPKVYTYLTLVAGADPRQVNDRLNGLMETLGAENPKTKGVKVALQPINDIHLLSDLPDELESNGKRQLVLILAVVGIIVLLLAWINYVNLETAQVINRTKEVGVRRILGSGITDIVMQCLAEYFFTVMVAVLIASVLMYLILPQFSYITGVPISDLEWSTPEIWVGALGLFVAGSIVTGAYPAFSLWKTGLMTTAKARAGSKYGILTRRSLIVIQFTCSISLMAFVLVIQAQLDFMRITNKKVDVDLIISIKNPTVYSNEDSLNLVEYNAFGNMLLRNSIIKGVTSSSAIPGMEVEETFVNRLKRDVTQAFDPTRYKILFVDYDFIPFYDLRLKAGRNYSDKSGDDENWNTVILNESAIYALGFKSAEEAINQEINFHLWGGDFKMYRIVGILEDYHHEAIKKPVFPTIFSLNHSRFQQVFYSVKLAAGRDPKEGLALVERSWKNIFPEKPFEYFFQDEYYDRQFTSELHFGRIFGLFAGVASFIACLGILGITLFETRTRLREISIRKVMGASIGDLASLLSKTYFFLILLSASVGVPIISYSANRWLSSYPSRIAISAWFFLLPLALLVLLVVLTSGIQTVKAALVNPVEQLKHE